LGGVALGILGQQRGEQVGPLLCHSIEQLSLG
jgi:hypothetical protein